MHIEVINGINIAQCQSTCTILMIRWVLVCAVRIYTDEILGTSGQGENIGMVSTPEYRLYKNCVAQKHRASDGLK